MLLISLLWMLIYTICYAVIINGTIVADIFFTTIYTDINIYLHIKTKVHYWERTKTVNYFPKQLTLTF